MRFRNHSQNVIRNTFHLVANQFNLDKIRSVVFGGAPPTRSIHIFFTNVILPKHICKCSNSRAQWLNASSRVQPSTFAAPSTSTTVADHPDHASSRVQPPLSPHHPPPLNLLLGRLFLTTLSLIFFALKKIASYAYYNKRRTLSF
jgi:hypothetical protein